MKERVAIIGGGVAGLTAGWLLHQKYDVALFEKSARIGGNAYTVDGSQGEVCDLAVATFTRSGYPNFFKILKKLNIDTVPSKSFMSSVNLDTGEAMYVTPSLKGLWLQKFAILNPLKIRELLRAVFAIHKGKRMADKGEFGDLSVAQALEQYFPELARGTVARRVFMFAVCVVTSMSGEDVEHSPAGFFFGKMSKYRDFISMRTPIEARLIKGGGTRNHVTKLAQPFKDNIHLNSGVARVERDTQQVTVTFEDGTQKTFEHVIFACHADQAYKMLAQPSEIETQLLAPWRYYEGRLVLHRDETYFPPTSLMRGYGFLYTERDGVVNTSVTGPEWMLYDKANKNTKLRCTQHPNFPIKPELIEHETISRTPIFDFAASATVPDLARLNGQMRSYFCGSYCGHGLHEDAVTSAIAVAARLGVAFE